MKNLDFHVELFIENKIARVSHALIQRINFPKVLAGKMTRHASLNAKVRPMLSEHDCAEVKQICALVLCATGALYRPLNFDDWKAIFRAVRVELRIDRQSKNKSEIVHVDTLTDAETAMLSMRAGYGTDDVFWIAKRKAIARRVRYERALIEAGTANTRKRKSNRLFAMRFLRFAFMGYGEKSRRFGTVEFSTGTTSASLRMAHKAYDKITTKGEIAMTAESTRDVSRTLKSLASL